MIFPWAKYNGKNIFLRNGFFRDTARNGRKIFLFSRSLSATLAIAGAEAHPGEEKAHDDEESVLLVHALGGARSEQAIQDDHRSDLHVHRGHFGHVAPRLKTSQFSRKGRVKVCPSLQHGLPLIFLPT